MLKVKNCVNLVRMNVGCYLCSVVCECFICEFVYMIIGRERVISRVLASGSAGSRHNRRRICLHLTLVHSALTDLHPLWHRSQSPLQLNCPGTSCSPNDCAAIGRFKGAFWPAAATVSVTLRADITPAPHRVKRQPQWRWRYANRGFVAIPTFVSQTLGVPFTKIKLSEFTLPGRDVDTIK